MELERSKKLEDMIEQNYKKKQEDNLQNELNVLKKRNMV